MEGQMTFEDYVNTNFNVLPNSNFVIDRKIRLIECFGGLGSQAKSLERLNPPHGWESWRLIEIDKHAIASYNAIHGTNYTPTDITKTTAADLGIEERDKYIYLLVYSFPCQSISVAGKGHGFSKANQQSEETKTRSGLLWEVERILDECGDNLPQILLMENVKNIISKKYKADFDMWCDYLKSKGYSNHYKILNSKHFGIPQNRERCFMVSLLGDYDYQFPEEIPLTSCMGDYLEKNVDKKQYITSDKARSLIDNLILDGKILQNEKNGGGTSDIRNNNSIVSLGYLTEIPHQSSQVYGVNGISPCIDATSYKHNEKVVEIKLLKERNGQND